MVNNSSQRLCPTKADPSDTERKIHDGPCHLLKAVQTLVRQNGYKGIRVVTEKGSAEMLQNCMDEQDLAELMMKLKEGDYHDSEWCKFSDKSPWFEADSYRVKNSEKLPNERDVSQCRYYLKFSVNKLGSLLLFFSVHRDKV